MLDAIEQSFKDAVCKRASTLIVSQFEATGEIDVTNAIHQATDEVLSALRERLAKEN